MTEKDDLNKALKIMAPNTDLREATERLHADLKQTDDEKMHQQLLENPKYAVVVHDKQINKIVDALENVAIKLNELDQRLNILEIETRFPTVTHDGPPEPPSGEDFGS